MAQENLTNNQFFSKYRLKETRPLSDHDIVCRGNLIIGTRPPEKFYKGWYPVRHQCSFPKHEPEPRAGLATTKTLQFRNHRIICDICDHPDNQLPPIKEVPCGNFMCKPNSVAPKCEQYPAPDAGMRDTEAYKKCHDKVDAYWRYHDPHYCEPAKRMPSSCRIHCSNWFKDEIDLASRFIQYKKLCREAVPSTRESREVKAQHQTDFESQRKFCLQQLGKATCKSPHTVNPTPPPELPEVNILSRGSAEPTKNATPTDVAQADV